MAPKKTKAASRKQAKGAKRARAARNLLLVATRKGAWLFHGDGVRKEWRADGPHFLGNIINHLVLDPRDRNLRLPRAPSIAA